MHPLARARVNFRTVFAGRVRFGGIFRRSLRVTTKKEVVNFFGKKKCTPRQNPGYAYEMKTGSQAYPLCDGMRNTASFLSQKRSTDSYKCRLTVTVVGLRSKT